MTLRKVMRWAILCISIALLGFAVWVGWRYLETKSMACECDDPVDGQRFAILNPFRDRAPERAAIEVIKAFQSRSCLLYTSVTGSGRALWPVLSLDGQIVWMRGVEVEPQGGIRVVATGLDEGLGFAAGAVSPNGSSGSG